MVANLAHEGASVSDCEVGGSEEDELIGMASQIMRDGHADQLPDFFRVLRAAEGALDDDPHLGVTQTLDNDESSDESVQEGALQPPVPRTRGLSDSDAFISGNPEEGRLRGTERQARVVTSRPQESGVEIEAVTSPVVDRANQSPWWTFFRVEGDKRRCLLPPEDMTSAGQGHVQLHSNDPSTSNLERHVKRSHPAAFKHYTGLIRGEGPDGQSLARMSPAEASKSVLSAALAKFAVRKRSFAKAFCNDVAVHYNMLARDGEQKGL